MRSGGLGPFIAMLLFVSRAGAEENGAPPAEATATPADATANSAPPSGIVDRIFKRGFRELAAELFSRFIDEQRSEFDRVAERYSKLVEFTERLEARDEAVFNERAEKLERLRLFTSRLEKEQTEREEHEFEARVALFAREVAFTRELERQRASDVADPESRPLDPERWRLYERR